MQYQAPSGFREAVDPADEDKDAHLGIFHRTDRCARIKRRDTLRRTDKPYSARPCSLCAKDLRS
jgi:hypothetical protein